MKPAVPRRISIATQANCRLVVVASTLAADGSSGRITSSRGSCNDSNRATPNTAAPYSSVADVPTPTWSTTAGITAAVPATPAISPSLELASTSSVSLRTTAGTSADFDTR